MIFHEKRTGAPARFLYRGLAVVLWALVAALIIHSALAQTFSASITGTVTDSSGAVVRGAKSEIKIFCSYQDCLALLTEPGDHK